MRSVAALSRAVKKYSFLGKIQWSCAPFAEVHFVFHFISFVFFLNWTLTTASILNHSNQFWWSCFSTFWSQKPLCNKKWSFWRQSGPDRQTSRWCDFVWAEWCCVLTMRKQLRTLGSTLLPPNAATSPSCRGIWMASWSSRLRWRWSVKPAAPDTCRKKSATTGNDRQHSCYLDCALGPAVIKSV